MKFIPKLLALGVIAASTTLASYATPIIGSISGDDDLATFNNANGTINFGASGFVSSVPTGSSFTPYFTNDAAMTFYQNTQAGSGGNFFYSTTPGGTLTLPGSTATSGGVEVFSVTEAGETLAFFVTSSTTNALFGTPSSTPQGLLLTGTGYFTETGVTNFDTTSATFTLNGSESTGNVFSFGGTAAASALTTTPIPEPSSLMLFGSGVIGAAGMVFRKRRSVV
jgi:hypothetical protein